MSQLFVLDTALADVLIGDDGTSCSQTKGCGVQALVAGKHTQNACESFVEDPRHAVAKSPRSYEHSRSASSRQSDRWTLRTCRAYGSW